MEREHHEQGMKAQTSRMKAGRQSSSSPRAEKRYKGSWSHEGCVDDGRFSAEGNKAGRV